MVQTAIDFECREIGRQVKLFDPIWRTILAGLLYVRVWGTIRESTYLSAQLRMKSNLNAHGLAQSLSFELMNSLAPSALASFSLPAVWEMA